MRKRLFIRLGALSALNPDDQTTERAPELALTQPNSTEVSLGQVSWLRMVGDQPVGGIGQGLLLEAAALAAGCQVIVLVPAADVLLTQATVPTQNRQRMIRAVPYALEERLGNEVEHLHFALGKQLASGQISTAVVDRQRLNSWLAALRQVGLQADMIVPETLLLPFREHTWFALEEAAGVTVRTGVQSGFAVDNENLDLMLSLAVLEVGEARPAALHLIACNDTLPELTDTLAAEPPLDLSTEACVDHPLLLLASGFNEQQVINLLQGDYSRREQLGKLWRPWRPALALLAGWLLLQGGMAVAEVNRLNQQVKELQPKINQIYLQAFPGNSKVVNARVQMERGLDALRVGQGQGGAGFLGMLQKSGPDLTQTADMQLRSVTYKDNELSLDLEIKDLQSLDQLKQRLGSSTGLEVEIQSASSQEDKVQSRMQIRPKGAKAAS